jgi:hypothetical protein
MTTAKIEAVFRAVPEVKCRIMDELTCRDAMMVARAFPVSFTKGEKIKYTNVVRNIITQRKWLRNMVREGYTFTVVGRDLNMVRCMDANTKMSVVLLLFVTRDNSFIPLTNDFISAEKFMFGYEGRPIETCNPDYMTVPSTLTLPSPYGARTVNAARHDTTISIVMPMVATSTYTPVDISQYMSADTIHTQCMYSNMSTAPSMVKIAPTSLSFDNNKNAGRKRLVAKGGMEEEHDRQGFTCLFMLVATTPHMNTLVPGVAWEYGKLTAIIYILASPSSR